VTREIAKWNETICRMASSGMLHRVALVRTDISANVFRSSSILVTLMTEGLSTCEMLVLTRATLCNISEDAILHGHPVKTSNLINHL
jgi:hypothetical protein